MNLQQEIELKRAELAQLESAAKSATCEEIGHAWVFTGGSSCGCKNGECSIPVHECSRCGDCDYGENDEAENVVNGCSQRDVQ